VPADVGRLLERLGERLGTKTAAVGIALRALGETEGVSGEETIS
jgi:hypothetical protein